MASLALTVKFVPVSSGTGDFVYSSAVAGYKAPSSYPMVDGKTYRYRAENATLTEWEEGSGVYTLSSGTLARTTVAFSSTGSKVSFTATPQVGITVFPADVLQFDDAMSLTSPQRDVGRKNLSIMSGGGLANLIATGSANTITLTADALALYNSSGNMFGATSVSLSIGLASSGANGIDTGAIVNLTAYFYFAIYNPSTNTVAGLVSLSATAPTMPSGYTYKRRVGWFYYSSGIVAYIQRNRSFAYTAFRSPVGGTQAAAYFSLANYVPPTATQVCGEMVSNNNTVTLGDNVGNIIMQLTSVASGQCFWFFQFVVQNAALQVYYSSSSSGGICYILSWEDNI
jgi:hypothetical protein